MLSIFEQALFQDLANDFIGQVKNAIKNKPVRRKTKAKGSFSATVNASGKLADSLRVEIDDEGLSVICLAYIDQLVYGAPPQRIETSVFEIERWLAIKGLDYNPVNVMTNLQKYGSSIFQEHQGANSGLLEDVNIEEKVRKVRERLTLKMIEEISSQIIEQFKIAA
jgi:hypothetical protein